MIGEIIKWMIRTGCGKTTTGNYIFSHAELANEFNVSEEYISTHEEEIMILLCKQEEVLDAVNYSNADGNMIDIIFGTMYCPNIEEVFFP